MRFRLLLLLSAALLGYAQTTSAQTFLTDVRDPSALSVAFYVGDGTAIDYSTNVVAGRQLFIDHGNGDWDFALSYFAPDNPFYRNLDVWIRRHSGLVWFDLIYNPSYFSTPLNEFAGKVVISGLFPTDLAYEVASVSYDKTDGITSVEPGRIEPYLYRIDGSNGTLTIQIPERVIAFNSILADAHFVVEEAAAVPEPMTAALILSLGAAAFTGWRKQQSGKRPCPKNTAAAAGPRDRA